MSGRPSARRAALVYNPRAGRWRTRRSLPGVLEILRRAGWVLEAEPTGGPGDAGPIAAAAVAAGAEVVFVLGGDGTVREAAGGLLGTGAALAPLPGGTVNVVATSLGLPRRPLAAARELAGGGRRRRLDVGRAGGEPFLMQASAGLDAAALARVSPEAKRRFGRAAVAAAGLVAWWGYGYPRVGVRESGGRTREGSFVAVCNLPRYAGGLRLAPEARPDDGRLDLVVFRGEGRWATLGFAVDLARGRHVGRRDVEVVGVEGAVRIEAPDGGPEGVPVQLDGDFVELGWPVEVGMAGEGLEVLGGVSAPSKSKSKSKSALEGTLGTPHSASRARFDFDFDFDFDLDPRRGSTAGR